MLLCVNMCYVLCARVWFCILFCMFVCPCVYFCILLCALVCLSVRTCLHRHDVFLQLFRYKSTIQRMPLWHRTKTTSPPTCLHSRLAGAHTHDIDVRADDFFRLAKACGRNLLQRTPATSTQTRQLAPPTMILPLWNQLSLQLLKPNLPPWQVLNRASYQHHKQTMLTAVWTRKTFFFAFVGVLKQVGNKGNVTLYFHHIAYMKKSNLLISNMST